MGLTFAAERFAFPSRAKFRQFCGQCRKTSIHENVCSNSSRCLMAPHESGFPCAKKQQPNTKHANCKAVTDRTVRSPLAIRKSAAIASFGANETKCRSEEHTSELQSRQYLV